MKDATAFLSAILNKYYLEDRITEEDEPYIEALF